MSEPKSVEERIDDAALERRMELLRDSHPRTAALIDSKIYKQQQQISTLQSSLDAARLKAEELEQALRGALAKLAHPVECLRLLPAEEWTEENGNYTLECKCEISKLRSALEPKP